MTTKRFSAGRTLLTSAALAAVMLAGLALIRELLATGLNTWTMVITAVLFGAAHFTISSAKHRHRRS